MRHFAAPPSARCGRKAARNSRRKKADKIVCPKRARICGLKLPAYRENANPGR